MPSSLTKIWIHTVFSTKNRAPIIDASYEFELYSHIKQHLENDLHCFLQSINGSSDHLHILFLLNPNLAVKDVLKNVKGESSHWVNSSDFIDSKFAWQKAYVAVSVTHSILHEVGHFIEAQKEYHKSSTFLDEQRRICRMHHMQFRLVAT